MSGPGRSNLGKNERGISQNFFGNVDPMMERNWTSAKNTIREQFDISPQTNAAIARGGVTTIQIDKHGDRLGKMVLFVDRAAIVGGVPVNFEGYFTIDKIQFKYSNKIFHKLYGEELYDRLRLWKGQAEVSSKAPLINGLLSPSEKKFSALQAQTLMVDLKVPWKKANKMLRMVALPNYITVKITWQLQTKVFVNSVANTNATGGALTNLFIRCDYYHLKNVDRQALFAQVHAKPLNTKFVSKEYHRQESYPINASTGTITYTLKLRNIKNDSAQIYAYIRLMAFS